MNSDDDVRQKTGSTHGMTDTDLPEEQIRRIAREEAADVADVSVQDDNGEAWSLQKLVENFGVSRRTALQAIGLIALGYSAPKAVLNVVSGTADAASQDNLTVPGTLTATSVDTDELPTVAKNLAQARFFHEQTVDNSGSYGTGSSGSGSITSNQTSTTLSTGTTTDSHARLSDKIDYPTPVADFSEDFVAAVRVDFKSFGSSSGDHLYFTFGETVLEGDFSRNHVGVAVDGGDLIATSADGTSQETTTISSGVSTGEQVCFILWDSSGPEAQFFVGNADPDFSSSDATHAANVPATSISFDDVWAALVDNDSNGNDNQLSFHHVKVGSA